MRYYLIAVVCLLFSCNSEQPAHQQPAQTVDTMQEPDEKPAMTDNHTTANDVIENLFATVSLKKWEAATSYYAPSAVIHDTIHNIPARQNTPAQYFKRLFAKTGIDQMDIHNAEKIPEGLYVEATARKTSGQENETACFLFHINDKMQITEQHAVACKQ